MLVTGQWKTWIPWVREEGGSRDLKEMFLLLHILANPITRGNLGAIGYSLSESLCGGWSIIHQLSTYSTNTAPSQSTTNLLLVRLICSFARHAVLSFRYKWEESFECITSTLPVQTCHLFLKFNILLYETDLLKI